MCKLFLLDDLGCFYNISTFNAVGADHHFFNAAIFNGPDILKIRVKTSFVFIVGVAHMVSHHGFFAAYLTYS